MISVITGTFFQSQKSSLVINSWLTSLAKHLRAPLIRRNAKRWSNDPWKHQAWENFFLSGTHHLLHRAMTGTPSYDWASELVSWQRAHQRAGALDAESWGLEILFFLSSLPGRLFTCFSTFLCPRKKGKWDKTGGGRLIHCSLDSNTASSKAIKATCCLLSMVQTPWHGL